MNVNAFIAGTRGDPLDSFAYDMNRLYPGKPDGYPTDRVAWSHWLAMKDNCDLQINIHSGGEHSYLAHMIFASDNPPSLELAAAMGPGWSLVFRSGTGGNNPSSQMGALGKGGITVELGGNCRTLTSDFHAIADDLAAGYLNVMRHYGMISGAGPIRTALGAWVIKYRCWRRPPACMSARPMTCPLKLNSRPEPSSVKSMTSMAMSSAKFARHRLASSSACAPAPQSLRVTGAASSASSRRR